MEAETGVNTEKTAECQSETSLCNKKMLKFMRFSLSMEDTELDVLKEPPNPQPEQKEEDIEVDGLNFDDVFRSLKTMSLNLTDDEESDNPLICNESDIVSDTANISYISEQIYQVINEQRNFMKTHRGCKYVASKQNKICLENTMSAKITIFSCRLGMITQEKSLGVPVMLNFTGTNNYLCCKKEEDILLTVTVYDKENNRLSADDPEKSLIFYMSQKCDGLLFFESALHRGWFIHAVNDTVKMKEENGTTGFFFE